MDKLEKYTERDLPAFLYTLLRVTKSRNLPAAAASLSQICKGRGKFESTRFFITHKLGMAIVSGKDRFLDRFKMISNESIHKKSRCQRSRFFFDSLFALILST